MPSSTAKWLGATSGERRDFVVMLYVPSQDRDGAALDHEYWLGQALEAMTELFGGATATQCEGAWRDDGRDRRIKREKISTVESYMAPSLWNTKTAKELAIFLHRMGRETRQGEIGILVNHEYFPIVEYTK